jgi:predicted nucleic acid-binding protein
VGLTCLDTSAVVGFLDADDALHPAARSAVLGALRDGERLAVSIISWAEALAGVRLEHHDERALRAFRLDLALEVVALDEPTAERAADLRAAGLRLPDALVLASAERAGATRIVTGDRRWATVDVTVPVLLMEAAR